MGRGQSVTSVSRRRQGQAARAWREHGGHTGFEDSRPRPAQGRPYQKGSGERPREAAPRPGRAGPSPRGPSQLHGPDAHPAVFANLWAKNEKRLQTPAPQNPCWNPESAEWGGGRGAGGGRSQIRREPGSVPGPPTSTQALRPPLPCPPQMRDSSSTISRPLLGLNPVNVSASEPRDLQGGSGLSSTSLPDARLLTGISDKRALCFRLNVLPLDAHHLTR